jgi:hypothetical protein
MLSKYKHMQLGAGILDASLFEVQPVITKLNRHKPPGSDQISVELIQAGDETLKSKTCG